MEVLEKAALHCGVHGVLRFLQRLFTPCESERWYRGNDRKSNSSLRKRNDRIRKYDPECHNLSKRRRFTPFCSKNAGTRLPMEFKRARAHFELIFLGIYNDTISRWPLRSQNRRESGKYLASLFIHSAIKLDSLDV